MNFFLPLCFKVLDCFCTSDGSGVSYRWSNIINFKRLTMKPAQDCPPALCISNSDIMPFSVFIFNIWIQYMYLITWLHRKANIGSLPSSAFTTKFEALLDTPSTYLQTFIEYWLWASKENKNDKTLDLQSFRFCLNLVRIQVRLKRSFERAITHYDVIVVVVIPKLFTNVVCTMAMLLPMILVLSQKIDHVLCM